jgi:SAM-dependent methyltransferase
VNGFDQFAGDGDYDAALNRGISLSGESKDFFIEGRLRWLRRCLERYYGKLPERPRIVDYGCGIGSAFGRLRDMFSADVTGVDISHAELAIAKRDYPFADVFTPAEVPGNLGADIAYSNGTFHHIPPADRAAALACIYKSLKPGGYFALWENNAYNPGTRWVMSRIPFDKDAITLSARESRRRLREAGFTVLRTDFLFIFPGFLKFMRPIERWVSRLPLGAQYQVLARR